MKNFLDLEYINLNFFINIKFYCYCYIEKNNIVYKYNI